MKKIFVSILIIVSIISCTKKKSTKNLEITGTVKGLKKGKLYVQRVQDTTLIPLDTIVLNGASSFVSQMDLDSPEMLYLFLDRGVSNSVDNNLLFFAEPGKINIQTDLESFLGNAKITGSKNHDLYEQYKAMISQFNNQQMELLRDQIMTSKDKKEIVKLNNDKQDGVLRRKYLYAANFALSNSNYEVSPYIAITDIHDMNTKYLDTIQQSMSPKVAKSRYGKKLTEYLLKIKSKKE
jgi:hypothetical protein